MSRTIGDTPIHSPDAEIGVIARMMHSKQATVTALESLSLDDFYNSKHVHIFGVIQRLYENDMNIDLPTITFEATKDIEDKNESATYRKLIIELDDSAVGGANIEGYIKIVSEKSLIRTATQSYHTMQAKLKSGELADSEIVDEVERYLYLIQQKQSKKRVLPIGDLLDHNFDELISIAQGMTTASIKSGYKNLDYITTGFHPNDLIVIASRPTVGKSSLAVNLLENISIAQNIPILMFSIEMSADQITQRLICSVARVSLQRVRNQLIKDDEAEKIRLALPTIKPAPIHIIDEPVLSIGDIKTISRRQRDLNGIKLIIIDYLQYIKAPEAERRDISIGMVSHGLKIMARQLHLPVIALAQIRRDGDKGKEQRPGISDLRESGNIEQDADVIIIIHRPRTNQGILKDETEFVVGKNRQGRQGVANMLFLPEWTRFEMRDEQHDPGFYYD
jgi:replicative DNA helicase